MKQDRLFYVRAARRVGLGAVEIDLGLALETFCAEALVLGFGVANDGAGSER